MSTTGRRWAVRLLWAALSVPGSAAVTAFAFGLVYGASLTPVGWRNALVLAFVGALVIGGLLGLAFVLYEWREADTAGVREIAVAGCVALTMLLCWNAVRDQALHDRGRPVQAVVTALRGSSGADDGGMVATLADASDHRLLGSIAAGSLAVGNHVTVTVDPRGRYDVSAGSPPGSPEGLWVLSALIAALQALIAASIGFSAARAREPQPPRSDADSPPRK
ncbi:hypothetical protein [Streptacidiphilus sp. PAMC 29251]